MRSAKSSPTRGKNSPTRSRKSRSSGSRKPLSRRQIEEREAVRVASIIAQHAIDGLREKEGGAYASLIELAIEALAKITALTLARSEWPPVSLRPAGNSGC